ncbi:MAG: hypothetical protein NT917_02280, partial [Microcystis aeruginosa WS75]|nr:hypothetical protein [Microcystis aeruginosa WS75]
LLRQVRNPARERSRNLNREVWESPSVYGGEDVKLSRSSAAAQAGNEIWMVAGNHKILLLS